MPSPCIFCIECYCNSKGNEKIRSSRDMVVHARNLYPSLLIVLPQISYMQ